MPGPVQPETVRHRHQQPLPVHPRELQTQKAGVQAGLRHSAVIEPRSYSLEMTATLIANPTRFAAATRATNCRCEPTALSTSEEKNTCLPTK